MHSDVTFLFADRNIKMICHSWVLSAASECWHNIIKHLKLGGNITKQSREDYLHQVNNLKLLKSIESIVIDDVDSPEVIVVTFHEDVLSEYFKYVLQFLYTGKLLP